MGRRQGAGRVRAARRAGQGRRRQVRAGRCQAGQGPRGPEKAKRRSRSSTRPRRRRLRRRRLGRRPGRRPRRPRRQPRSRRRRSPTAAERRSVGRSVASRGAVEPRAPVSFSVERAEMAVGQVAGLVAADRADQQDEPRLDRDRAARRPPGSSCSLRAAIRDWVRRSRCGGVPGTMPGPSCPVRPLRAAAHRSGTSGPAVGRLWAASRRARVHRS